MPDVSLRYRSFGAFCEAAMRRPEWLDNNTVWQLQMSGRGEVESFAGSAAPMHGVVRFLRAGWPEGVAAMREEIGKIRVPSVRTIRRAQVWDSQGDSVDMQRLYSGSLDRAFRRTRKTFSGQASHVHFVLNWAAPQNVNKGQMFYRGAVITALCEALGAAGYSTAVSVYKRSNSVTEAHETSEMLVRLKQYTDPLALAPLVAMTGHAAAYRRVGFAVQISTAKARVRDNLGMPQRAITLNELRGVLPQESGARVLLIPSEIHSRTEAQAFVKDALSALESGADVVGGAA